MEFFFFMGRIYGAFFHSDISVHVVRPAINMNYELFSLEVVICTSVLLLHVPTTVNLLDNSEFLLIAMFLSVNT
jgi:hypothetical protein